jgi:hypothetical protein
VVLPVPPFWAISATVFMSESILFTNVLSLLLNK